MQLTEGPRRETQARSHRLHVFTLLVPPLIIPFLSRVESPKPRIPHPAPQNTASQRLVKITADFLSARLF